MLWKWFRSELTSGRMDRALGEGCGADLLHHILMIKVGADFCPHVHTHEKMRPRALVGMTG